MTPSQEARLSVVLPTRYEGSLQDYTRLIVRCEEWGYYSAWVTEVAGGDAFVLATALGAATGRMRVGTGAVAVGSRSPASLGMAALSVTGLIPDRFVLGLGSSTRQIVEEWHGHEFETPLKRLEQTVSVVRSIMHGDTSSGEEELAYSRGFHVEMRPLPSAPPIYLAALRPASLALAGRVADGVILTLTTPEHMDQQIGHVRDAVAQQGGSGDPKVVVYVRCCVTDMPTRAYEWMKGELAWYSSAEPYRQHFTAMGYGPEMAQARDAWMSGDFARARSAMPDRLVQSLMLAGSATEIMQGLTEFHARGADDVAVYAIDDSGSYAPAAIAPTLRAIREA